MAAYWLWWVLAAVLVGAELLTGTFYLLAVGIALAVGGFVAWFGAPIAAQLLVAAIVALLGAFAAHRWRVGRGQPPPTPSFDIGQPVRVQGWNADGTARVSYRGSLWTAELAAPGVPRTDPMYIVDTRGSTLILSDRRPA